ncbi:MAG: 5'-nucleotidase C-terminal domain-containing protein [Fimbriimonadaceae bacterium]|nr:5'-nucleotidase C-terminal domain-containing protein [Fimbriimonadaceae bacterium]QYK57855.1 MAG: 5'-nucleotidase C-terminal domain-containing protein [Fimbriimonadaceae bacterium]
MVRATLSFLLACWAPVSALADYKLTLLHVNDTHSRIEPSVMNRKEIGGMARLATLLDQFRASDPNPVFVHAGDAFQGTLYFNVYEGLADLAVLKQLGVDVMALGNHEFDRGPGVLANFVRLAQFPILSANLDLSREPSLERVVPSVAIEIGGEKVGFVGCVTEDLPQISNPGETVTMKPLVESVQTEIDRLTAVGVNKIVVVSHIGYQEDLALAKQLRGADVIVGGHSHSLLGAPELPGPTPSRGDYPTVAKDQAGGTTLVVQAWEWAKVLGRLRVNFDDDGRVIGWEGAPVPVVDTIPEKPEVAALVAALKKPIEALMNQKVGETTVDVARSEPGQGAMADLITDAMLEATRQNGSVVAFMNSGGVRAGFEAGPVTYGQLINVQPFANTLVVADLTGEEILAALQSGKLFVSAGSSFTLDRKQPEGRQVRDVVIAGEPLVMDRFYRTTWNSFVAGGGDGIVQVRDSSRYKYDTGMIDVDAFIAWVKARSPLAPKAEGRIKVVGG